MRRCRRWLKLLGLLCILLLCWSLPQRWRPARRAPAPRAAPAYAPPPPPMPEAARAAAAALPCFAAPPAWGAPTRVHAPRFQASRTDPGLNWTDAALLLHNDVAVAESARCARLTRARGREAARAGDHDAVVVATHLDVTRLHYLLALVQRWQGCVSAALRLCREEEWAEALAWRARHPALRLNVTFHAVLSHGLYPNALRNAPLEPFSPWAAAPPLPAPWVLVVDVDGLPSVGEGVLARWMARAAAGELHPQDTLTERARVTAQAARACAGSGAALAALQDAPGTPEAARLLPPYLRHLAANNTLRLRLPTPLHFLPRPGAPSAADCARSGGRPQPLQCSPLGIPGAQAWALRNDTSAWAAFHAQCVSPPPRNTLYILPSFDVLYYPIKRDVNWSDISSYRDGSVASRAWNALLRNASAAALERIPPDAPPSHAHFLLRSLVDPLYFDYWPHRHAGTLSEDWGPGDGAEEVVSVQAQNQFVPSYASIVPWRAWLGEGTGVLPLHYALAFEPYFVARAPLPSTTPPPLWAVFDEAFRNTWFDKCALFFATAGAGGWRLALLPQVFWLNDHALDSVDTAPRGRLEELRKAASYDRLQALLDAQEGLSCRSMCPCIPRGLEDVIPGQGFLIS